MTRQSLPSSSGLNFLQKTILDLRLPPPTLYPGDLHSWRSEVAVSETEGLPGRQVSLNLGKEGVGATGGDYLDSKRIKDLGICGNLGFSGISRF